MVLNVSRRKFFFASAAAASAGNLGIRYEFFSPLVDTQNRFSSFDPSTGTFRIATQGGLEERSLMKPDYAHFGPRVGLAYRLTGNTVLRSGYALFYSGEEPLGAGFWLQNNPNFVVGVNLFAAPPTPLLKLETGLPANLFSLGGVAAPAATGIQPNARIAHAQNWNLTLQRTLGNWSAQASYVGSNGFHFLTPVFLNQARPGTGTVQSRRAFPAYANITFIQDRGKTNYHARQTQIERTFSNGLSILSSYTFAKAIDDHEDMFGRIAAGNQYPLTSDNLSLERSLSGTNIRHRVTHSMLYQLPLGRGRKFLTQAPKALDLALGGWNLSAVTSFFSGSPFSVITSQDACGCGLLAGQFRADRLRDGRLPEAQRSIDGWFDVRALALPARGSLGNSGRNILISPGTAVVNLSMIKSFPIHEDKLVQFRAEFFNLPNHANFGLPGNHIETAAAGLIRSADPGREVQLALRFQFKVARRKPRPQCLSADLGEPELCVPGMGGSGSPGGIRTVKASADRILQKLGTIREHSALEIGPKRPKWSQRDTFTSYFKSAISVASKPLRRVGTRPCKGRRQRFKYIPGHHIFHNLAVVKK